MTNIFTISHLISFILVYFISVIQHTLFWQRNYFYTLRVNISAPIFQVWVWGDNSGGQGGPAATTTTVSNNSPSPSKSPNKLNIPGSLITSPRRLEVPEEHGSGLVRDLASGDNYLIVITVDGLTFYVGKLRYCSEYFSGGVKFIHLVILSNSWGFHRTMENIAGKSWHFVRHFLNLIVSWILLLIT